MPENRRPWWGGDFLTHTVRDIQIYS